MFMTNSKLNLSTISINELKNTIRTLLTNVYDKYSVDNYNISSLEEAKKIALYNEIRKLPAIFIHGSPGVGKSASIKQLAEELNIGFTDVRLTTLDPVDLRGLPFHDNENKLARWLPAGFLPTDTTNENGGIILIDELNAVPPAIQSSAYQLVLDKQIGEYTVPNGWIVVCAVNKMSDRGVTYRLPTPLANRFIHVELVVDEDQWLKWAVNNNIDSFIINFIRLGLNNRYAGNSREDRKAMQSALFSFNPKSVDIAFATPRSWEHTSELAPIRDVDIALYNKLVRGTIGQKLGGLFFEFINHSNELPNPEDVLNGKPYDLPDKYDSIYAMVSMLITALRRNLTLNRLTNFVNNFLLHLSETAKIDIAVIASQDVVRMLKDDNRKIDLRENEAFMNFLRQHTTN